MKKQVKKKIGKIYTGQDSRQPTDPGIIDPEGGATHTAGSSLHRKHGGIDSGTESTMLGPRFQAEAMQEKLVWVPGVFGQSVPTSTIMALYIHQFNEEIANTQATVIDATEGGALLQGTDILPFAQVIERFASGTKNIQSVFDDFKYPERNLDRLNEELERVLAGLQNAKHDADKGTETSARLSSRIQEGVSLRQADSWIEVEDCFSRIYESETIKIALEQALFQAVYFFIQKERPEQVELRLSKYQNFFQTFTTQLPYFDRLIRALKKSFSK